MATTIIRNGLFFDGTGAKGRKADVVIQNGKVAAIHDKAPTIDGAKEIDATDKWVTPGFVDMHTHYDAEIEVNKIFNFYSGRINNKIHKINERGDTKKLIAEDAQDFSKLDRKHELEIATSKFIELGGVIADEKNAIESLTITPDITVMKKKAMKNV